jgi:hypothetical protein
MTDKIIVSSRGALTAKYKASGLAAIRKALDSLIAADKKRGFVTRLIYLDDAAAMKRLGAKAMGGVTDYRGAKTAIDRVCAKLQPAYLMILGAPDVVPHQNLTNPAYKAGDDDDDVAWGDLPYACDTPYGRDPAQFVGPGRVVSRLPDLTGASNPSHLIALLKTATQWRCRPAKDYQGYFGLSAAVWKGSTRLSLDNIFGNASALLLSPPKGPKYPGGKLGARMHFINCHGGAADAQFYGQSGTRYPISLSTRTTGGSIRAWTVASVECCYGAQLYDSVVLGLDIPICQSYLRQGAYGYFGSTTIAYGPADDNGAADLICQYFLINVLAGESIGLAALKARQRFVQQSAQMDPIDLKTLAQFCLYGDPSVHPVQKPLEEEAKSEATARFRRNERRAKAGQTGDFLKETKPTASKLEKGGRRPAKAKSTLANLASRNGLPRAQSFAAFKVKGGRRLEGAAAKVASAPSRYYLTVGWPRSKAKGGSRYRVAIVAKEVGGQIIDYRIYHER